MIASLLATLDGARKVRHLRLYALSHVPYERLNSGVAGSAKHITYIH